MLVRSLKIFWIWLAYVIASFCAICPNLPNSTIHERIVRTVSIFLLCNIDFVPRRLLSSWLGASRVNPRSCRNQTCGYHSIARQDVLFPRWHCRKFVELQFSKKDRWQSLAVLFKGFDVEMTLRTILFVLTTAQFFFTLPDIVPQPKTLNTPHLPFWLSHVGLRGRAWLVLFQPCEGTLYLKIRWWTSLFHLSPDILNCLNRCPSRNRVKSEFSKVRLDQESYHFHSQWDSEINCVDMIVSKWHFSDDLAELNVNKSR